MTAKPSRNIATTSAGHTLGEACYLDARFLAYQTEYEAMLRWVGVENSWRVLDAGCGSGPYLPLLCELVGTDGIVTAFDLAPENIEACQTRLHDFKPACRVETKVGSLLELSFEQATFDAVWCANTSQYLSDEELSTALLELKRVTRPGGLIAIKEADVTCFQFAHIEPVVMWHYLEAASRNYNDVAGVMRAIDLPRWLRHAGLINVRWQTTNIARFGPLQPVEIVALGNLLEFTAKTALNSDVPENDIRQWQRFLQMLKNGQLLEQPDFFHREGAVVVVGEVE